MGRKGAISRILVPPLAATLLRILYMTMRVEHRGVDVVEPFLRADKRYIQAFWHARLLPMAFCRHGPRVNVMISQHRDGELIARTVSRLGMHVTRGSTTRGGAGALREAVRRLEAGFDLAVTPDGPRGPRHRVQAGVIEAARLSGAPIVPATFSARPARFLNSWDRFLLPYPFSRGLFLYGEPMTVPRDLDPATREALRKQLEDRLRDLTRQGDEEVGWGPGEAPEP
jgi:lysophospholipid acyltransferase (LPLAT)-like uncharacterized protein